MSQKKKGRVTFTNIVALLGLALLGFFTFMGAMFFSGGTIGTSLAIAAGAVVIISLLLAAAIYCKGVESNFDKWKKVEIVMVILFWAFAILPGRYVIHCFEILGQKEQMQHMASDDVAAISKMFNDYEAFERNAMGITRTGLENSLGQPADQATTEYMSNASIQSTDDILTWMSTQRGILTGSRGIDGFSYTRFHENVDSVANSWLDKIKAWDIMFVASHAGEMQELAPEVAKQLSENSLRGKLPVIEFENGIYTISRPAQFITTETPRLKFSDTLGDFNGSNPIYYVIYLIILLLIFLDYIMAYRSSRLDIKKGDGSSTLAGGNKL